NDPNGLVFAQPVDTPNSTALPKNRPKQQTAASLVGGVNHDPAVIKARSSDYEHALTLLEGIKDVNMVAVPDRTDAAVQGAVLDHCFRLHDRFAIFDAQKSATVANIENQRNALENDKGFGALYLPWIEVTSEKTGQRILVPPSGHVAGIYARTDIKRGVHKAPAGNEAIVSGALGVQQLLSDADQGFVNLKGINVIRVFQHGGRPVVWGARTTSKDTNWQYVNIRRLFLFLEESIQEGIRSAVFEPNNPALWQKLKRTITAFLAQQWRDGALFGTKVEEAFYVRIDETLNPDNERALGRLYIEIGVRPSYPAEFIIVRIGIWQGGSEVSEG
ncbi:MAG TPA: phage tail sheath subtilisin-like domain-containing protein, partial [Burkholderiales bacterium]|nr:phage tail sheath subtilisin-like domain-containing protein [Burkholderiales bacterium]